MWTGCRAPLPPRGGRTERHGFRRPSATVATYAVGRLSPMAFLVGVSLPHTHPPRIKSGAGSDAPNELAPRASRAERSAQVGGANSWRVFLPLCRRHAFGIGGGDHACALLNAFQQGPTHCSRIYQKGAYPRAVGVWHNRPASEREGNANCRAFASAFRSGGAVRPSRLAGCQTSAAP